MRRRTGVGVAVCSAGLLGLLAVVALLREAPELEGAAFESPLRGSGSASVELGALRPAERPAERAGRAPSSARSMRPNRPRRTAAASGPPPAPEDAAAATLRGVKGLVRDAATRRPIAGAWIAWGLPSPTLAAEVLRDPEITAEAFSMITGADGRFAIDRLADDRPVASTLFVVARGYACARVSTRLGEEPVVDLRASGVLEVVLVGGDRGVRPRLQITSEDPARAALLEALPDWKEGGGDRWALSYLEPGRYTLSVDGGPARRVELRPGRTTTVRLERPSPVTVRGRWVPAPGASPRATLALVDTRSLDRYELTSDAQGRWSVQVLPGTYVAFVVRSNGSELRLGEALPLDGVREVVLSADGLTRRNLIRLRRDGAPHRSLGLGLVGLDDPHASMVVLEPTGEPGAYAAEAPDGRYAVYDDAVLLGEVTLAGGAVELELTSIRVAFRWVLPAALRDGEVVRGAASILARPVLVDRTDLRDRFVAMTRVPLRIDRSAHQHSLAFFAPGVYRLVGQTDLGPFAVEFEVRRAGRNAVVVRLGPQG